MAIRQTISALFISVALAGCAGITYEPGYMHNDGWRSGTIESIGSGDEYLEKLANSCTGRQDESIYAKVGYKGFSYNTLRCFPLSPGSSLRAGDRVLINIHECAIVLRPNSK